MSGGGIELAAARDEDELTATRAGENVLRERLLVIDLPRIDPVVHRSVSRVHADLIAWFHGIEVVERATALCLGVHVTGDDRAALVRGRARPLLPPAEDLRIVRQ